MINPSNIQISLIVVILSFNFEGWLFLCDLRFSIPPSPEMFLWKKFISVISVWIPPPIRCVAISVGQVIVNTVEPFLRGHPDERPPPLERPLDNVNLNINALISNPNERPPLLKGHFSDAKAVAS